MNIKNEAFVINQTFNDFIITIENTKVYKTCFDLLSNSNGMFIAVFGENLCGKTRLLNIIKKDMLNKNLSVNFTSYEDLISEYIASLNANKLNAVVDNVLSTDVLIVDNMQFIAGKNSTQEKMANTIINTMLLERKTIVMAFDRPIECFDVLIKNVIAQNPRKCKVIKIIN